MIIVNKIIATLNYMAKNLPKEKETVSYWCWTARICFNHYSGMRRFSLPYTKCSNILLMDTIEQLRNGMNGYGIGLRRKLNEWTEISSLLRSNTLVISLLYCFSPCFFSKVIRIYLFSAGTSSQSLLLFPNVSYFPFPMLGPIVHCSNIFPNYDVIGNEW